MDVCTDLKKVMLTKEQILARIKELAAELDAHFVGKEPVALCILMGSIPFFADLVAEMQTPLVFDCMRVSSYGEGTTSGTLKIRQDVSIDVKGKDILVVEDIIDSGNTLFAVKNMLLERGAASVCIVALLDKPSRRTADIKADFIGFEIEDEFVVGYGLDYAEKYRNLSCIGVLKREVYEK